MKSKRYAELTGPQPKDETGKNLCRWCRGPIVESGRRTWCSAACVHDYKMRSDGNYIRAELFKRDKGVCAACGLDTQALGRERWKVRAMGDADYDAFKAAHPGFNFRKSFWDADHIVEVVRGGGACGLDNMQTLCQPCHRSKTKRLASERARERRQARQPELELP